jgi:hypothetical protein
MTGTIILQYSFQKFFHSLPKHNSTWKAGVELIQEEVANNIGMAQTFEEALGALDLIYDVAHGYHNTKDEELLSILYMAISGLNGGICWSKEKDLIARTFQEVEFIGQNECLVDLESDKDINPDNTLQTGTSWSSLINIYIRRLLRLAVTSSFVRFFMNPVVIHCCPPNNQIIMVYPGTFFPEFPQFLSSISGKHNVTVHLHVELNVFQMLLNNALIEGQQPYWVIGVSQSTCATSSGKAIFA